MQSSAAEHVDVDAKQAGRFSKGGLITAAVIAALSLAMSRDMGAIALMIYGPPAIALAARSLVPGMTWGRGVLVAIGGVCAGMFIVVIGEGGTDNLGPAIIQALFAFVLLKAGFKRGKIQWRKKDSIDK